MAGNARQQDLTRALATEPAQATGLQRLWPWAILLTLGTAWGLSYSLMKIATESGQELLGILVWHHGLASLLLLILCLLRRTSLAGGFRLVLICVTGGVLSALVPSLIYYYAAPHVPAGVLSITVIVAPIATFLISALIGLEPFSVLRMLGVALGALAVVLLVVPEASLPDRAQVPWVLAACFAGICYAAQNLILARWTPKGADPSVMTGAMFGTSAAILAAYLATTGSYVPLSFPPGKLELAIIGMAVISAFAYALLIYLINQHGAVFGSQCAYVITLSGVGWGILIFGEGHSVWIWISLAVMLLGLALVQPHGRPAGDGAA